MKRTRLSERLLPNYTRGEEIMNTVTHIVGGVIGLVALVMCVAFAALHHNIYGIVCSAIYGVCMIALYCVSSVYHGLPAGMGKKVMQVIDHCTIYFLIAGTYTVMALSAIRPAYPRLGWGLFAFEWVMAAIATTLTAIDLKVYSVLSMICYIGHGLGHHPLCRHRTGGADTSRVFAAAAWRHQLYHRRCTVRAWKNPKMDALRIPYFCGSGQLPAISVRTDVRCVILLPALDGAMSLSLKKRSTAKNQSDKLEFEKQGVI